MDPEKLSAASDNAVDRQRVESKAAGSKKRIAIFIVTYNAASTLSKVLDRIPDEVWAKVEEVFVFDDSSQDDTVMVGMGYKAIRGKTKLNIFRNERNLGYGGNQIRGYKYAISQGYDIVALLHGDGQYAPEALPDLLAPLEADEADAVFGSRMMHRGEALRGGMPMYKYVGNKILTYVENAMLNTSLSEFHSGYRLYSCHALKKIPFEKNTHDFHFDTQIIIQFYAAGLRIQERPIPTYYGDEICHVNGTKYAKDVIKSVLEYELHKLGVKFYPEYEVSPRYTLKTDPLSSHTQLLALIGPPPRKILDLGCGPGELAHVLIERGHDVVGVDLQPPQYRLSGFVQANINDGIPPSITEKFDTILLADVLEHLTDPLGLLVEAREHLTPGGVILASLPNAVHWSVRAQIAMGRFDYASKGILDRTHLRFYTDASARRLFADAGLEVATFRTTAIPWNEVLPRVLGRPVIGSVERVEHLLTLMRPNLFAYQNLFELRVTPTVTHPVSIAP
jgi:glycosyltransferase involved in cell wall biosynthesis